MDIIEFKRVVYESAKHTGYSVVQIHKPGVTPNFYAGELRIRSNNIFLLCTHDDDWALSENFDPMVCELQFIEMPEISDALRSHFKIALHPLEYLQSEYVKQEKHNPRDINYWKPKTMGEVIFNWWD